MPALSCLLERRPAVVIPLEHTLGIGGDDRLAHAEVPSHGREMERLVSALAARLGCRCTGGHRRLSHRAKRAPAGCVVQRQPALPRVVLLREQPRLLADEAELQRARTRPLTEGIVQRAVSLQVQIVVMLQLRQGSSAANLRPAGLLGFRVDRCVVGILHLNATLHTLAPPYADGQARKQVWVGENGRKARFATRGLDTRGVSPTTGSLAPRNDPILTTSIRGVPGSRGVRPQPPQHGHQAQAPLQGGGPPQAPRR